MSSAVVDFNTRHVRRPRPVARPNARPVRLTLRGRIVVLLALVALTFAVLAMVGGPAGSTGSAHHPSARTVVVEPGQTLWDIARRVAPEQDPRNVIAEIVDLNALTDAGAIRVGQPLYVPQP